MSGPRAVILRHADRLMDHPGPSVVALQRCVMLALIDATFTLMRTGRRLWRA